MKSQEKNKTERVIPAFAIEAEEAEWWYQKRNLHGKQLRVAVKGGEAQVLTKEKLRARLAASRKKASPVVALRIPADDLTLARKQAERKGLPYQTYIKSLLHETLTAREKRKDALEVRPVIILPLNWKMQFPRQAAVPPGVSPSEPRPGRRRSK